MIGHEIATKSGDDLVRFVRALGQHRYVASRLHLVHAFAIEAASTAGDPALAGASAWAREVLSDPTIDRASKDERLHRRATDAELTAVVHAFWGGSFDRRAVVARSLRARLDEIDMVVDPEAAPFDEAREEDIFPLLVDAGWELFTLRALDPERHKGAITAFDDALAFDVAKFEEENAVPELVTLHELPAIGAAELLHAVREDGSLRAPFVLWTSGNETYNDYVMRGVLKTAKLDAVA